MCEIEEDLIINEVVIPKGSILVAIQGYSVSCLLPL